MKLVSADINLFSSDRNLLCFCRHSAFFSEQTAISYLYRVNGSFFFFKLRWMRLLRGMNCICKHDSG